MTTKDFIEKAKEGGYNPKKDIVVAEIFLDPKAFQAVGKVEGWEEIDPNNCGGCETCLRIFGEKDYKDEWEDKMLNMTRALIEGKSVEEFLKTL